jgi:hypothetical protein
MQNFVFGQSNQSAFGAFQNPQQNPQHNQIQNVPFTSINSMMVSGAMDDDSANPAPMKLPMHMTKPHARSNSVTPIDHNSSNYMSNNFLFDQLQSAPNMVKPSLTKWSSEKVDSKININR